MDVQGSHPNNNSREQKDWGGEGPCGRTSSVTFPRIEEHVYTMPRPTECSAQWMKQTQDSHETEEH